MKKLILLVLGFGVIISCYEKENINCLTFEIERPQLFIKIINNEGVNLIENGTINSTNITIEENSSNISFTFIPEGQFGDFNEFDNSIALTVPNESDFRYTVAINNFETIVIDRTPFSKTKQKIKLQVVNPKIYKASYPCWFFDELEFTNYFMKSGYKILEIFKSFDGENKECTFKGIIMQKK